MNDSLIVITPYQLKITNLIFLEHSKFKKTIPILEEKIISLENINKTWEKTDSVRLETISEYETTLQNSQETISNLEETIVSKNKKLNRLKKWTIGGFGISAALIIILAIK